MRKPNTNNNKEYTGSRTDENGNAIGWAASDSRRNDYYPFGKVMPGRSAKNANPNDVYKFTGHSLSRNFGKRDREAGIDLDYMQARNYDPEIGRFMQVDPRWQENERASVHIITHKIIRSTELIPMVTSISF